MESWPLEWGLVIEGLLRVIPVVALFLIFFGAVTWLLLGDGSDREEDK